MNLNLRSGGVRRNADTRVSRWQAAGKTSRIWEHKHNTRASVQVAVALACWFGGLSKWELWADVVGVRLHQSGIGKQHAINITTQILTGKVACSTGIPFIKKTNKKMKTEKKQDGKTWMLKLGGGRKDCTVPRK